MTVKGNTIEISSWTKFAKTVQEIEKENAKSPGLVCFRGMKNADLFLETTLERRCQYPYTLEEYYNLMADAQPAIEAFTDDRWQYPAWSNPASGVGIREHILESEDFRYMVHLRHHGFPSPLLDWTLSPFVAAYFAFAHVDTKSVKNVAVFVYSEMPNRIKMSSSSQPQILSHGGMRLKTHARHFRQQACYTMCVQNPKWPDGDWMFGSHEQVFEAGRGVQDKLYKIIMPSTEKNNALEQLDKLNLNEFSLFATADSLMETLAFRFIDRRCSSVQGRKQRSSRS